MMLRSFVQCKAEHDAPDGIHFCGLPNGHDGDHACAMNTGVNPFKSSAGPGGRWHELNCTEPHAWHPAGTFTQKGNE